MTAFQGILQALIVRGRTGEGRHVAVSLYHALADWMNVPYLQYVYGGHTPVRSGLNDPTIAPYGDYLCQDGKAVLFSIQNETRVPACSAPMCSAVRRSPTIRASPRTRSASNNRPALDAVIDGVVLGHAARGDHRADGEGAHRLWPRQHARRPQARTRRTAPSKSRPRPDRCASSRPA